MPWFWNKKDYAKGAQSVVAEFFNTVLSKKMGHLYAVDRSYLVLQEKQMRDFLFDGVRVSEEMAYGANCRNPDSFPDCDDFAYVAIGQAIKAAVKAGLRALPAFGYLEYESKSMGGRHAANFAIVAPMNVFVYEPQNGRWKDWDSEVKAVYRAEFA